MDRFPEQIRLDDVTFALDPLRLLIHLEVPTDHDNARELLRDFDLHLEDLDEQQSGVQSQGDRISSVDTAINHSATAYWVRTDEELGDDQLERIEHHDDIAYVAPVFWTDEDDLASRVSFDSQMLLVRLDEERIKENQIEERLAKLAEAYNLTHDPADDNYREPYHLLRLQEDAEPRHVLTLREELLKEPDVLEATYNVQQLISPLSQPDPVVPNDPQFAQQWNMTQIDADVGWNLTTGDNAVVVGIIDTGCDMTHPDLDFDGPGFDTSGTNDGSPNPFGNSTGHGTSVAGIAAGVFDNNEGIAGVAGDCQIHAIALQTIDSANVQTAINQARTAGVDVVNMSFSMWGLTPSLQAPMDTAIQNAHDANIVLCASSGNDANRNSGGPNYPSSNANVICVGATDQGDRRCDVGDWGFDNAGNPQGSNFGPQLDVVAPGVATWSTDIQGAGGYNNNGTAGPPSGNYFNNFGGTSGACPHVTGLAALLRSLDASLDNEEIRDIIERTCDKVNPGTYAYSTVPGRPNGTWVNQMGYGRINVYDALSEVLSVELITPELTWEDQLPDYTTARSAVFEVRTPIEVQLNANPPSPDPPFSLVDGGSVPVEPTGGTTDTAHVLVFYTGTSPGSVDTGTVDIACPETGEDWTIDLTGDTKDRDAAGVSLVLDRSDSMNWSSGVDDGTGTVISRLDLLKRSIDPLLALLFPDDGIGSVAFSTGVTPLTDLTHAGPSGSAGTGRDQTESAIDGLTAGGVTSIGEGLIAGAALFDAPGAPSFDDPNEAVIVFTDGHENPASGTRDLSHPDVVNAIDSRVFAVGMGTPGHLNPAKLNQIVGGSGGYMVMTGDLQQTDRYRLAKYFLQILTDVTNDEIVTDPEGFIAPGEEHRIPFQLTRADIGSDVVLLTPQAQGLFDLAVETPHGDFIDESTAAGHAQVEYVEEETTAYYRVSLPAVIAGTESREGTWHAVLSINEELLKEVYTATHVARRPRRRLFERGLPYNLSVHARSNLAMDVTLSQDSNEPGATVTIRAVLTEYELPIEDRATVDAEVILPDGTTSNRSLAEVAPGVFEESFSATMVGLYPVRVYAKGKTLRGRRFTREALRTAGVWQGGDTYDPVRPDTGVPDERLCDLLECLIDDAFRDVLEQHGVDVDVLRECLDSYCRRYDDQRDGRRVGQIDPDVLKRAVTDPQIREAIDVIADYGKLRSRNCKR